MWVDWMKALESMFHFSAKAQRESVNTISWPQADRGSRLWRVSFFFSAYAAARLLIDTKKRVKKKFNTEKTHKKSSNAPLKGEPHDGVNTRARLFAKHCLDSSSDSLKSLQNLLEFIPLMKHICPKYIWIQLTVFAIVRQPAILWAWLKGKNEMCASMYKFTFACPAGPTYCKMQGTGINFLHFAETFGLWMTLACEKQSENRIHCTRTHHSVAISTAVLKSPPWCLRHPRHALHIGYAARPSLRKRISYSNSVMTD